MMTSANQALMNLINDESGQDLIEYALLAGLLSLAAVVSMTSLGTKLRTVFDTVGNQLTNAL